MTVGAVIALPVTDYLPLEWFVEFPSTDTAYVRVIPTYETDWPGIVSRVVGAALVVAGCLVFIFRSRPAVSNVDIDS